MILHPRHCRIPPTGGAHPLQTRLPGFFSLKLDHETADNTDMNVNSLSSLVDPYLQGVIDNTVSSVTGNNNTSSIDQSSLALPQDGSPQLSPFAQILSTLQQLQQSNPTEYQQVTSQIASNLQSAAQTATTDGDTSQATELSQLATDFTNASQNNTLPNIQDLAQALGGGQWQYQAASSNSSSTGTTDSSSTGTTGSTTSTSESSSSDLLSQLLSAFYSNNTSATENNALNPLAIITNTLNSANLS